MVFDWSYSAREATTIYPYINCILSLRPTSYGPEVTGSNSLLFFGLAENYPSGYCIIIISKKTNRINWGFQNLPVSHVFEEKYISLLTVPYSTSSATISHTSLYLISCDLETTMEKKNKKFFTAKNGFFLMTLQRLYYKDLSLIWLINLNFHTITS